MVPEQMAVLRPASPPAQRITKPAPAEKRRLMVKEWSPAAPLERTARPMRPMHCETRRPRSLARGGARSAAGESADTETDTKGVRKCMRR